MNNIDYEGKINAMNIWADSLRKEMAQLINHSPSQTIYHYTDINGLIGLISSGCVWATHFSRLNDWSENEHGFDLVKSHMQNSPNNSSKHLIEKVLLDFRSVDTYIAC
jgi:hypothetical protein